MEFALGVLHWTEEEFWSSTYYAFSCAWVGHCKANGIGKWSTPSGEIGAPWTKEQKRKVQENTVDLMQQFPDVIGKKKKVKKKG